MGLADKFPQYTGVATCGSPDLGLPGQVMDYYDGNTVTALWNYAQNHAMSDNNHDTTYGPSATGQTVADSSVVASENSSDVGTDINDIDPYYDDCSKVGDRLEMTGQNVGNLLDAKGVTWGWFQGGFGATTAATSSTPAGCGAEHENVGGEEVADYSAHHDPFQYYASTADPHHTAPTSEAEVGHNGQAHHQYDLSYFYSSIKDNNLPSVSFVKQAGLVSLINTIESSRYWSSTAIYITYDDSDGWYDHQAPPNVNSSSDPAVDMLDGAGCNTGPAAQVPGGPTSAERTGRTAADPG